MKKLLAIILTVFMTFSMGTMLVACKDNTDNNTNQSQELTKEEKVRQAIIVASVWEKFTLAIDGNETKSCNATITNIRWSGESICTVSGVMQVTDIYGTVWKNNYDCVVTTSDGGETWKADDFMYKSKYWSKK